MIEQWAVSCCQRQSFLSESGTELIVEFQQFISWWGKSGHRCCVALLKFAEVMSAASQIWRQITLLKSMICILVNIWKQVKCSFTPTLKPSSTTFPLKPLSLKTKLSMALLSEISSLILLIRCYFCLEKTAGNISLFTMFFGSKER